MQLSTADAAAAAERRAMMQLTSDYWLRSQKADGFLPYGYDFLADRSLAGETMNALEIVRQAAAFYVWAKYYDYSKDERLRAPLARAIEALQKHSVPFGKSETERWLERTRILSIPFARWKVKAALEQLGLLYDRNGRGRVLSGDGTYASAPTNGVALALLTELEFSRASGDDRFERAREAWLEALVDLRIPGSGFREWPHSIDESDYPNGEGWFALAAYCERRPSSPACRMLDELDHVMLERYAKDSNLMIYHWGVLAAATRYRVTRDQRFLAYVRKQTAIFLDRLVRRYPPGDNVCASMEGVAAALATFDEARDTSDVAKRARNWLAAEAARLSRLQVPGGTDRLKLGGDAYVVAPQLARFGGAFLLGDYTPKVQVDVDAHCLSAMIMIERARLLERE